MTPINIMNQSHSELSITFKGKGKEGHVQGQKL
jgi:hypothetical protein